MFTPDKPISCSKDDLLSRSSLASRIAEMIQNIEIKESYVIGIEGKWGSGKTSFINLIIEYINNKDIQVLKFNPWIFNNQNELISDFFISYLNLIHSFSRHTIIKTMKSYVSKLFQNTELVLSPGLDLWGAKVSLGHIKKIVSEKSLGQSRIELNNSLRQLNQKFVVIIDDIDRLNAEETMLVFRLSKLIADFPNTIFILAYDRVQIEKKFENTTIGQHGADYLKKIIQISFNLPDPDRSLLQNVILTNINLVLFSLYGENFDEVHSDQKRWDQVLIPGFLRILTSLRDIKRYISSLSLSWAIVGTDDVNPFDFMCIELIRIFYPQFYVSIACYKWLFVNDLLSLVQYVKYDSKDAKEKQYLELLTLIVEPREREAVDCICKALFPNLNFHFSYDSTYQEEWQRQLRICSYKQFDLYFQLCLPVGAVGESAVRDFIRDLDNIEISQQQLRNYSPDTYLISLLSKLILKIKILDRNRKYNLLLALSNIESEIDRPATSPLGIPTINTIKRLAYEIFASQNSKENYELVHNLITTSTGIYYPVYIACSITTKMEKGDYFDEKLLLEEQETSEISRIILLRIQELAISDTLMRSKHMAYLLYKWKTLSNNVEAEDYIKSSIMKSNNILIFLNAFKTIIYSSDGDYEAMDKRFMQKLVPLEIVEAVIASYQRENADDMTSEAMNLIALFNEPLDDMFLRSNSK